MSSSDPTREERLAQQLRANLRRRKQAARKDRDADAAEPVSTPDSPPPDGMQP